MVLFLNSPVLAQETTGSPRAGKNKLENSGSAGGLIKQDNKEKAEANKEKAALKRKDNIHKYYLNIKNRLLAAVDRLKKLGGRISSRLDKSAKQGLDVVSLQLTLTQQQAQLIVIEEEINNLDTEEELLLSSDNPQTAFLQIKNSLTKIKDELKAVHQAYVQVITQLKTVAPTVQVTSKVIPTVGQ